MKFLILMLSFLVFTEPALALVNMRNGSYTESWIDFIEPSSGIEMKIERVYSSRSLFDGLFGFGWCSAFETRLDITSDGILNLVECGGGLEIAFFPSNFDTKSAKDTIDAIVADYQKKRRMNSSEVANFRAQLTENPKMRFTYANIINGEKCPPTKDQCLIDIKKIKTTGNVFLSKAKGMEKIIFNGHFYERRKFNGDIERFNYKGQLTYRSNNSGNFIKLKYSGKKIQEISDNNGRRLTFTYNRNGQLEKISNGRGLNAYYRFKGDDLVSMKNMWGKTYEYQYDNFHNMIGVDFPDNTKLTMRYDNARDWIRTYTNRKGCTESYAFSYDKDQPNHYISSFNRFCGKGTRFFGQYEFFYQQYPFSKENYLHRAIESYKIKVPSEKTTKDVVFEKYLGRPLVIQEVTPESNLVRTYNYLSNGLVNLRETRLRQVRGQHVNWEKVFFKYDSSNSRILKTTQKDLNGNGQVTSTQVRNYIYNDRGQLRQATDGSKRYVQLKHHKEGPLAQLKNERKSQIDLGYQVGIEKPTVISDPTLGKVAVTYDSSGEVESVKSKGKRNVATSVVEKFIEMIKFLGPMGEHLKL